MIEFTGRRNLFRVAALVVVGIAAAFTWPTLEVSASSASSHALHMQTDVQERPDEAHRHHADQNGGAAPDCLGAGAICPMMGLCHPAMLVDSSWMALVLYEDDAVASVVGRSTGINPSIILPPPRQRHV